MITRSTPLRRVALIIADVLRRHRIRAALTGGACAAFYTGGRVHSMDADFVLLGEVTQANLDQAMGSIGFTRKADHYVHASSGFFVEFPRGPLAIGEDAAIRPVERRDGALRGLALTATDSCRDRLAAFYHWKDLASLRSAIEIATAHRVSMTVIERWSEREGAREPFDRFRSMLRDARAKKPRPKKPRRPT